LNYESIIDRLEDEIRQYRIEYQRFFNGDSHVPPEAQGGKIRKRLRSFVGAPQLSAVDRFRLGGLESRYNSLDELFRRRLRDLSHTHRAQPAADRAAPTVVDLGTDSDAAQVADLYEAIYAERTRKIDLERFHAYLVDQATKVRQRSGCEKVRFTVRAEDGKPKLKVRPLAADK